MATLGRLGGTHGDGRHGRGDGRCPPSVFPRRARWRSRHEPRRGGGCRARRGGGDARNGDANTIDANAMDASAAGATERAYAVPRASAGARGLFVADQTAGAGGAAPQRESTRGLPPPRDRERTVCRRRRDGSVADDDDDDDARRVSAGRFRTTVRRDPANRRVSVKEVPGFRVPRPLRVPRSAGQDPHERGVAGAFEGERRALLREARHGGVQVRRAARAVPARGAGGDAPAFPRERRAVPPRVAGGPALLRADGALRARQLRGVPGPAEGARPGPGP